MESITTRSRRLLGQLQPAIVRVYRVVAVLALAAILIGLCAYVTVNVFYYFNRSWVRPVVLSQHHARVIEVQNALSDARLRKSELEVERSQAVAELADLDRLIATNEKFEAEAAAVLAGQVTNAEAALLSRELGIARLERLAAIDRKPTMTTLIADLERRIGEQDQLVSRLSASPYASGATERRVVGFVPYQNLGHVREGVSLYACSWGLVRCHKVGHVVSVLQGEAEENHPHDDSLQRGVMVELSLTDARAGEGDVLFAGSKPLWWL